MQPGSATPVGDQIPVYDRSTNGSRWRDRLVAGAVCLVIGAGIGFAGGRLTAPSGPKTLAEAVQQAQQGKLPRGNLQGFGTRLQPGQSGQPQGGPGGGTGRAGQPAVQGEITAVSGGVVTLSTVAGELKLRLTDATEIRRAVAAKQTDLGVGDTVSAQLDPAASSGQDGTVAASSITEEPAQ
ncbi:MAG TPA: hypothetical protein VGR74_10155 [Actinomycetota bacterium]|nr:hypothetical protein [Actinomycetota bacterium]